MPTTAYSVLWRIARSKKIGFSSSCFARTECLRKDNWVIDINGHCQKGWASCRQSFLSTQRRQDEICNKRCNPQHTSLPMWSALEQGKFGDWVKLYALICHDLQNTKSRFLPSFFIVVPAAILKRISRDPGYIYAKPSLKSGEKWLIKRITFLSGLVKHDSGEKE